MRILDKYLYKELFATFFAVLTVFLLITFGAEATKLLAVAAEGKIPADILFQVLLLNIPPALEVILPLVALLSVMLAVGRLYQDQEMVVLNSCGITPRYFQKRVLLFLLPLAILTAWISLVVTPWSYEKERALITEAQATSPLAALIPGRFNQLSQGGDGGDVFYAEAISRDLEIKNIWIRLKNAEQDVLMIAPSGYFKWVEDNLILVLLNGKSYQGLANKQNIEVRKFERFEGYLPAIQTSPMSKNHKEIKTSYLWGSEDLREQALLQWRIVIPLSIIVMGLIGLKMSKSSPREGRFAKMFYALILYVIYNHLLVTLNVAVSQGEWPVILGLWVVPLVFILFAFYQGNLNQKGFLVSKYRSLIKNSERKP